MRRRRVPGEIRPRRDRAKSKIGEANDVEHAKSSISAETNVERKGASVGVIGYYVAAATQVFGERVRS
jgi:hypothetical protein